MAFIYIHFSTICDCYSSVSGRYKKTEFSSCFVLEKGVTANYVLHDTGLHNDVTNQWTPFVFQKRPWHQVGVLGHIIHACRRCVEKDFLNIYGLPLPIPNLF